MTASKTINMSLDAINAGAKALVSSAHGNRSRSQTLTVAAIIHLSEHGNSRVFEKLYAAIGLAFGKGAQNTWRSYVIDHTWLVFNPNKLSASKLKATIDANFSSVFVKDQSKSIDIEGAKAKPWFDHEPAKDEQKPMNAEATIAAFVKRLNKLLADGKLVGTDGKPMPLADVRSAMRRASEALEYKVTVATSDGSEVSKVNPAGASANTEPNVPAKLTRSQRKAKIAEAKMQKQAA